jgi:glycine/D-amino acid oxidase-like deaminating enzyme
MGYLTRARELGVRLECGAPVTGIRLAADGTFSVDTPAGRIACETLVNAAGAWAGQVARLAGLENPVLPYRRCIYFTEPFAPIPRDIPLTIDVGSGFYLRKEHDNVLFGLSNPDEPSSERLDVDWEWLERVIEAGIRRFPTLADAGLAMKSCWAGLYEITPDHLPILGRHPDRPTWVDANGFSGHGVLHSPATGMLMAEEILDGQAHTIEVDSLRLTRFREGALAHEPNIF